MASMRFHRLRNGTRGSRGKSRAPIIALGASLAVLGGLVVLSNGFAQADVELNDGGVWVTNTGKAQVGKLNGISQSPEALIGTSGSKFDVLQSGRLVIIYNSAKSELSRVDVALSETPNSVKAPENAQVAIGAKTVGILDPETGNAWVMLGMHVDHYDYMGTPPTYKAGKGAKLVVDAEGTAHIVSPANREIVTVTPGAGNALDEDSRAIPDQLEKNATIELTTVGSELVIFNTTTGKLILPGGDIVAVNEPESMMLQQAGPERDSVLYETSSMLVDQPLDGGDPKRTESGAEGRPVAPVFVSDCAYSAWGGNKGTIGQFVRTCSNPDNNLREELAQNAENSQLMFRVNRDMVVLNDLQLGDVWTLNTNLALVENWDERTPKEGEGDEEEGGKRGEKSIPPTWSQDNHPPQAVNDDFGVRAGRTTILPVLDNDRDSDGDLLTVSIPNAPDMGEAEAAYDGAAIQFTARASDVGKETQFKYTVSDGRGGESSAYVKVTVRSNDENSPPERVRQHEMAVEAGKAADYNVLPDWRDPDGDDMTCVSARSLAADLEVRCSPDGVVSVVDGGQTLGVKDVEVTLSDVRESSSTDTLQVDVRGVGELAPTANPDRVAATVGKETQILPLDNDQDPAGSQLQLAFVEQLTGAGSDGNQSKQPTIVPDFASGAVRFTAHVPDVYYLKYSVTNGTRDTTGLIRVDATVNSTKTKPIAVRDVGLLKGLGPALIDVTENDIDPTGGVLVVTRVDAPSDAGISVAVLEHQILRVTASRAPRESVVVTYTVSNGIESADGQLVVVPVPATDEDKPPVAVADEAKVRVGDVVTMDVLSNDSHPGNVEFSLDRNLDNVVNGDLGKIFTSDTSVRFLAGKKAGTVKASYTIVDTNGQRASSTVTIKIVAMDKEHNKPPEPKSLMARVLAGSDVNIAVPLNGIDPEGDSVTLVGIEKAPLKGQVSVTEDGYLFYEAAKDVQGADTLTYVVRDRLGAEARASVTVGIAPPESVNQRPVAEPDTFVMRPNTRAELDVLANDSDPDNDMLMLDETKLESADGAIELAISGNTVMATTPAEEGEYSFSYGVSDGRGGEAIGVATIYVRSDADLMSPIARDLTVDPALLHDSATVDVDLAGQVHDPDGVVADLELTAEGNNAKPQQELKLSVTAIAEPQIIPYTVTDRDKLTATAFIFVPGLDSLPPALKSTEMLTVPSGKRLEIKLDEQVSVVSGRSPRITSADKVSAVKANGDDLVVDESTLQFISEKGYVGQASITFEVTDGTSVDDTAGNKAVLTLSIQVTPIGAVPLEITGTSVEVPSGGSATVNLRQLVTNDDPQAALEFSLGKNGASDGLHTRLDGYRLSIDASATLATGEKRMIPVSVLDETGATGKGTIEVVIVASARPLVKANNDYVTNAVQGRSTLVDVLANDTNPFPGTALQLSGSPQPQTANTVDAQYVNGKVRITPRAKFVGTAAVRYRVADATQDPSREVDGWIYVAVKGAPDTPGAPRVMSYGDKTVTLFWTAPSDNGSPITHYIVTGSDGSTRECVNTFCIITGLTNNKGYYFTVRAVNAYGQSESSVRSASVRPDTKPDTPNAPTVSSGDGMVYVTWAPVQSSGSPVTNYTVYISPTPSGTSAQRSVGSGTSYTWSGLQNGTQYTFRIRATSSTGEISDWGPPSVGVTPAGVPKTPAAPTAVVGQDLGTESQVNVSWTAPNSNGSTITQYEIAVILDGQQRRTTAASGGLTSTQIAAAHSQGAYTFKIRARNAMGYSAWSKASSVVEAFGAPGRVSNLTAIPGNASIQLSFTDADGNGTDASRVYYQYRLNSGSWTNLASSRKISGLANGQSYQVGVRACVDRGSKPCGGAVTTAAVTPNPNGPAAPRLWVQSQPSRLVVLWDGNQVGWNIVRVEVKIDGGAWEPQPVNAVIYVGNGPNQTHTVRVRAVDVNGRVSPEAVQTATTS